MGRKNIDVSLSELEINRENFRHSPLDSELDAIHYLISEDYESYLKLARSIEKDCRTFTVLLLEKDGKRILMDANRRVSVLKIFDNPRLIPEGSKYDDLRNLCVARGSLGITSLSADIYYDYSSNDKNNLMKALDELHIRENKTKKDWNALSQYRASIYIGSDIKHPWIKTMEYYNLSDKKIIDITDRKTDIFSRMFRRSQLCINENGKIGLENDHMIFNMICKTVSQKSFTFSNGSSITVNTRTAADTYKSIIDDIINICIKRKPDEKQQADTPDTSAPAENTQDTNIVSKDIKNTSVRPAEAEQKNGTIKNYRPLSSQIKARKTLISEEQRIELSSTRHKQVDQIACELSRMRLEYFPISIAVVLRSFLQYSFEWYADSKGIGHSHENLTGTINSVNNRLYSDNIITKEEKARIKFFTKNNDIMSLLNETTHNYNPDPISPYILMDFYDAIHPIIKVIFQSGQKD
ncbi:hypothetical protein B7939_00835 [Eggerthia catenaformis]|nr:hypothetical protein B7939_00835 [Eggerthia catenaformis]